MSEDTAFQFLIGRLAMMMVNVTDVNIYLVSIPHR